MALRRRQRPLPSTVPDTSAPSIHPRSRARPIRLLAEAYGAVGGALLAAAKSALHPPTALAAALGLVSVEKVAPQLGPEFLDDDANLDDNIAQLGTEHDGETARTNTAQLGTEHDGETARTNTAQLGTEHDGETVRTNTTQLSTEHDGEMAPLDSNAADLHQGKALLPRSMLVDQKEGKAALLDANLAKQDRKMAAPLASNLIYKYLETESLGCTEIEEVEGPRELVGDDMDRGERKGAPPPLLFPNAPPHSLGYLISSSPASTATTTSQRTRARKPHQPFWKKGGGLCRDNVATSPKAKARRASRAGGIRRYLAAAVSPAPGSSVSKPAAAAVGAAVPIAPPPAPPTTNAAAATPPSPPPPPPPPPPGSGGAGAVPQGGQPAAGGAPPPVPPPGPPAPAVAAAPPAPNDRYFNWESNHINLAVQIICSIFQMMGFGDALKKWKDGHLLAFTIVMLAGIGVAGIGMMSSTTAVRVYWIRIVAANLARATSTVSVVLIIIALSEPIGYGCGVAYGVVITIAMLIIWVWGDPVILDALVGWGQSIKAWTIWDSLKQAGSPQWIRLKQAVSPLWDSMSQKTSAQWNRLKQKITAVPPPPQQQPRAQP